MSKISFALVLSAVFFILTASCGRNKKSMKGDEEVEMADFIEFFDPVVLPYSFTDTLLTKKTSDSNYISNAVFRQFISDTMFTEIYKKDSPKIYAVGSFFNEDEEGYLLLRTLGKPAAAWIIALNKEMKPAASMLLLSSTGKAAETNTVVIDKKFTITLVDDYKKEDGSTATYSSVYAYNTAGLFMEIMNDGLRKGEEMAIENPLDSLPATHARTGKYKIDDKNFVSIKNGDSLKTFMFFINLRKGTDCVAELKGEAKWIQKDSALFEATGEACSVGFKFSGNTLTVHEELGCGNRRPAGCTFNGNYKKEAMPKKKAASPKK